MRRVCAFESIYKMRAVILIDCRKLRQAQALEARATFSVAPLHSFLAPAVPLPSVAERGRHPMGACRRVTVDAVQQMRRQNDVCVVADEVAEVAVILERLAVAALWVEWISPSDLQRTR